MSKKILFWVTALVFFAAVAAEEATAEQPAAEQPAAEEPRAEEPERQADDGDAPTPEEGAVADAGQPKTMSGMSILGNEEAPKALVIVPWKSSELGADMSLSDTLDDRARPVDHEVFMRELSYYNLRSGE
jgi:hypothetical protein